MPVKAFAAFLLLIFPNAAKFLDNLLVEAIPS
jgi:hypothetical protein